MAVVITHKERTTRLRRLRDLLTAAVQQSDGLDKLEASMIAEQQLMTTINTSMQVSLTQLDAAITEIASQLTNLSTVHRLFTKAGMPPSSESIALTNTGSATTFTNLYTVINPSGTSHWGGLFADGDMISLSECENAADDGVYEVVAPGASQTDTSDILSDGAFASGTGWTAGSGWTISGGKATHSTGTATLTQAAGSMSGAFTSGKAYYGSITTSGRSAGSLVVSTGTIEAISITTDGTYTFVIVSDGSNLTLTPSNDYNGAVESISLLPVRGCVISPKVGTANAADTTIQIALEER